MILEDKSFPIVRLHYDADPQDGQETLFETFERLLALETPFVLIGFGGSNRESSHEERKSVNLWMKRNRAALRSFVTGMVYVEPKPANRFILRSNADTYKIFWGYPMLVSATEPEALLIAERLLAGTPADDIVTDERPLPGVA